LVQALLNTQRESVKTSEREAMMLSNRLSPFIGLVYRPIGRHESVTVTPEPLEARILFYSLP
jgi:hypothetical protein